VTGSLYFGAPWDVPALEGARQVPTPVGEKCLRCAETIEANDRGWIRTAVELDDGGKPVGRSAPIHTECDFIGVGGHLFGVCSCTGYDTSTRAAAVLAWERAGLSERWHRSPGE
jgi:hypothetical protein